MHFAYIFHFLVLIVGPLVKMVLRVLGFGFVTYFGINLIIDEAKNYIMSQTGQTSAVVLDILGLMKVDVAINIMLAAVVTRFVLAGLNKATDTKRNSVWGKPGQTTGSMDF